MVIDREKMPIFAKNKCRMKLTYVLNSGFVLEAATATIVFDFFRDTDDGFVSRRLTSFAGRLYVLASHWHPDHFRRDVLQWRRQRSDISYIFSRDIKRLAQTDDVHYIEKGQTWADDTLCIKAFGSTDVGVSFLVEIEGKRIFHAGDLNNWHWKDESTEAEVRESEDWFLREVDDLRRETGEVDVAIFPVDPRQGTDYMLGAEQFVERIKCGLFVPAHFGDNYAAAQAFRPFAERAGCRFANITAQGAEFEI